MRPVGLRYAERAEEHAADAAAGMRTSAASYRRHPGDLLGSLAFGRRPWLAAMAVPCTRHDAGAGEPCWTMPAALCGRRVGSVVRP